MIIERRVRGRRFVRVGTVRRTVHIGRGRISIWRRLGKYPIRPGTYGIRLKSGRDSGALHAEALSVHDRPVAAREDIFDAGLKFRRDQSIHHCH